MTPFLPVRTATRLAGLTTAIGAALVLVARGAPAQAHGMAAGGFAAGALHPLLGADHLLLLLTVAAGAAVSSPHLLLWAMAGAGLGAGAGAAGMAWPAAELTAALAIPALALLLLGQRQSTVNPGLGLTVAAAVGVHGLLHGQEAPAAAPLWWLGAAVSAILVGGIATLAVARLGPAPIRAILRSLAVLGGLLALVPASALLAS